MSARPVPRSVSSKMSYKHSVTKRLKQPTLKEERQKCDHKHEKDADDAVLDPIEDF